MNATKGIMIFLLFLAGELLLPGIEKTTPCRILDAGAEWRSRYEAYQPEDADLTQLARVLPVDLRIKVYLGLWCRDSLLNVPVFIKIMDSLPISSTRVEYHLCQRKANAEVEYYFRELEVTRIPTFIFYLGNQEIGRIVENPQDSMLGDIQKIVSRTR
jgi:hypothetical protein